MLRAFKDREAGVSLIELMIAVMLLAVVQAGASAFFKRVMTSDVEAQAKAGTISEITLFLSTIERDFKLRAVGAAPLPPLCPDGTCTNFTVNRIARNGSGDEVDMPVKFETKCQVSKIPNTTEFLKSHNLKLDITTSETGATNGRCLKLFDCKLGEYPQVIITPDYSQIGSGAKPTYPRFLAADGNASFPNLDLKKGVLTGTIGAALCGYSAAGSKTDRLVIEAVFVNSEGQPRVEKREVSIPRRNIANIQMLPNTNP